MVDPAISELACRDRGRGLCQLGDLSLLGRTPLRVGRCAGSGLPARSDEKCGAEPGQDADSEATRARLPMPAT